MNAIAGRYINLDRSRERRAHCEAEIHRAGLAGLYARLEAVDGAAARPQHRDFPLSDGKLGCWLSHLRALEGGLATGHHLHVLEDDFCFTGVFRSFYDRFDRLTAGLEGWDLIFCDVDLAGLHDVAAMRGLIQRVSRLEREGRITFEDARVWYAAGNSSYIVNRASLERLRELMVQGFSSGLPNDLYLRRLIREGRVRAYVTLPLVTTVSEAFCASTILGDITSANPSIAFATLFRRSLAWGADTGALLRDIRRLLGERPAVGDRGLIYAHLVAHLVSGDFRPY